MFACKVLGPRGRVALGRLLGMAYGALDSRKWRVLKNMARAVGPVRARRFLSRYHEHMGLLAVEYATLAGLADGKGVVGGWIDASAAQKVKAILESGKGVVAIAGHIGNWELTGYALASVVPLCSLYRPSADPYIDAVARSIRERSGQSLHEKFDSMRWSLRVLRNGQVLGLLVDQDGGSQGVFVPFFGELASTLPTAARLAMRTGAPILPIWSHRLPDRFKHRLYVGRPIKPSCTGDEALDVLITTRMCNKALEEALLAAPWQWLWTHRRWRTRPSREDIALWEKAEAVLFKGGVRPSA